MPSRGVKGLKMGLDVALGVVILIAAIRGWLQGFVYQAIRIAGLVACVYLATPVRDQAKPHVISYIPKIQPEFVDRGLWWAAAALTYVVLVGVTTLAIKMTRRPEIPGLQQSSRNDQFAGFLVGAAKGVLVAAFMTAGIQKYALAQLATITWADQQVKTSMALRWNEQFQPATKIWTAPPVQHFVGRIQRMGLQDPADENGKPDEPGAEGPVLQTASRAKDMEVARAAEPRRTAPRASTNPSRATDPQQATRDAEVDKAVDETKEMLDAAAKPSN